MARGKKAAQGLTPEEKLAQALVPMEEQPYRIPENWCWTRLFGVIVSSDEKTEEFSNLELKYVGLENLEKDGGIIGYGSPEGIKSMKNVFHAGQILYGKLRPYLNKHDIATFDGICSTDILVFSTREPALPQIVNYYFNQSKFIEYVVGNSKGINLPRVSENVILNAVFPLPPLAEQQRIVDRIESIFAKLDEAKEKAQAVVDGFEVRKAAILYKAFSGELTKQWRKEHNSHRNVLLEEAERASEDWSKKEKNLLEIEQKKSEMVTLENGHEWIHCTIGAFCRITNGSTPSRQSPEYWSGNIPWISSGEVRNNIICTSNECISEEGYNNSSVKLLPAGTVLIAMIGEGKTRGQSAILDIDATINQNIAAIMTDYGYILPRYIWYWLQMNYAKNRERGSGSGPQALNCQRVRELDFFVPNKEEQSEIVSILNSLIKKEQQAKEVAESVLDQIDTMKKAVLARAFCGELGTNDPAEESAVELLKTML